MKKIITILVVICLFIGQSFAYTPEEFTSSKAKYKVLIEKKLGKKIDRLDGATSKKLVYRIQKAIGKYERSRKLSDKQKLKQISLLHALLEVLLAKKVV